MTISEYDAEIERTFKITPEECRLSRHIDYWVLGLTDAEIRQKEYQIEKKKRKPKKDRTEYYKKYYQNKKGVAV